MTTVLKAHAALKLIEHLGACWQLFFGFYFSLMVLSLRTFFYSSQAAATLKHVGIHSWSSVVGSVHHLKTFFGAKVVFGGLELFRPPIGSNMLNTYVQTRDC